MGFIRSCWTVVVPLVLVIIATFVLTVMGKTRAAADVQFLGTSLTMLGNVIYVVVWHSRSRWPGLSWRERFWKFASFQR